MEKMKLTEINSINILNFLKINDGNMDKDREIFMAFVNLCMAGAIVYLSKNKLMWGIGIIYAVIVIMILIYFLKKIELNNKNFWLVHGIYNGLTVISMSLLSIVLLEVHFKDYLYWIIGGLVSCIIFFAIFNMFLFLNRIRRNYYEYGMKHASIGPILIAGCVIALRPLHRMVSGYILIGVLCAIGAIALVGNSVYFFIKSYCYMLIENKNNIT